MVTVNQVVCHALRVAQISYSPTSGVVVTGGASGIGRSCARLLAGAGRPVAVWDLDGDTARAEASAIANDTGVATIGVGVDVTDTAAYAAAIDASRSAMGSIGGLVHAAGAFDLTVLSKVDDDRWDQIVNVNLKAEMQLVRALLRDLRENEGSAVVGISSIEAFVAQPAFHSYCASKAGLLGLTRSLALELARYGIRVNAVCPGFVDTPMLTQATSGQAGDIAATIPLGRLGRPEDIAGAVRYLLSDDAAYVTGSELVVDGGHIRT